MATSSKFLCSICEGQHLTKCSVIWCPECDEGFCNDCEKYHKLAKATRHHDTISIDAYQKLPTDISKIVHHCEDHGRKFQNFCPYHEQICCPICISENHKSCSGLMALDDVVKTSKTSTFIENLELSITEIRRHIDMIIKDRQQNLAKIEVQRQQFHDQIKRKREKMNCLLDKVETTLINELTEAENKIKLEIQNLISKLEERNETVGNLQNSIAAIKTHATDLQTFFGCKTLSEQVSKEEKYMEALSKSESLRQINLKCDISDKVYNILTTVTSFGSISISYNPLLVFLSKEKDKQAQIMSPVEIQLTKYFHQVSLKVSKKIEIPKGTDASRLTGVDICPNGTFIVDCDNNRRLMIFNKDGYVNRTIPFSPDKPYDVTCLDDSMIAVSIFDGKVIKLVDILSATVSQTIRTDYVCAGITQRQGKLIYCGQTHGIILHNPNDNLSKTLVNDGINRLSYVTTFIDNIYYTNSETHTVSCYKTSGEKVWDYRDDIILKKPYGLTVDNHENVYVASAGTDSIVIISSDGKQGKQLLKGDDGIKVPRAIQFDKVRQVLIVLCYNDNVMIFEIP